VRKFFTKIKNRNLRLAVIGSGQIGLPTATLFANVGFTVTATDINSSVIENINKGICPFNEPNLQQLLSQNVERGKLNALLNSDMDLNKEDVIIIAVPTPIYANKKPKLSFLIDALRTIGTAIKKQMLIVISSTLPPGTTQSKIKVLLESLSDLKSDADFYLAYVPERISPGKALQEFVENPRLVGGVGPNSTKIAAEFFRTVCNKVIETDATTAEIAKTTENTFRDVNIAFANQLALICEQYNADVKTVIHLANTHPRVNVHNPGPGVGGPCLTKDPYLLIHHYGNSDDNIVIVARIINDRMPTHIVNLTQKALKDCGKDIKNSKIVVLGAAYKADVADCRFSPAKHIVQKLKELNAEIIVYDPHCINTFGGKKAISINEAVKNADSLLIITDHAEFKNLNLLQIKNLMRNNPSIIDGKRIINPADAKKHGFIYFGLGYGKAINSKGS